MWIQTQTGTLVDVDGLMAFAINPIVKEGPVVANGGRFATHQLIGMAKAAPLHYTIVDGSKDGSKDRCQSFLAVIGVLVSRGDTAPTLLGFEALEAWVDKAAEEYDADQARKADTINRIAGIEP